ncbi:MAG: response regulator [Alphaproteobacteria bacterium]|nr:response regulator [Alphaproteobacteria bacterium]
MAQILVVDDDPHILDVVAFALDTAGHRVLRARDGDEALMLARTQLPDLIVLDVGLPGRDGLAVCRALREGENTAQMPILFLSARDEEIDRILGLEMGADDYVTKPFSPRELSARIAAILRRLSAPRETPQKPVSHGALSLDLERAEVKIGNQKIDLTALELALLNALVLRPGQVLKRSQLMDRAYPDQVHVSDRTIDSHIRNLRAKCTKAGSTSIIETVPRMGFKLGSCLIDS